MKAAPLLCALLLTACASHSGVVPISSNSFMISKQAATGFPGLGNLKAEVIQEAAQYCSSQGRRAAILKTTETQPPYILGNYPRVEIEFSCE